jgi:putative transcriptional regulator
VLELNNNSQLTGFVLIFLVRSMDNRLKELRARFGFTQDELATKTGVRRETIVFLEKGKYNPSLKLAHDVACAFEMSIEEVFFPDSK